METKESNILIATRRAPGDNWVLINDEKQIVHKSLTETLEAYFQKTQKSCEFRLAPLKGELYIITTEEVAPAPPKRFNIYGDY
jgi:hypothetical protein